ncbi:MAG: hypothetical protein UR28_C0012G0024 [Candidatus Peregrinibacteria bacterium GW2011_GWF2_33_10]|nr:MAG: hypothetical protein UR28_C0012G0024 [Candidatus Peregrinibacteria bacterium GW2011_GWF2_33_10]OGJ44071.1 MAG: hypothetical protein A2263_01560 [Candidatus Peregrinibacteria bacterium RIFOXYA2_FULL_33_21]OGJ45717.1 MAG: hypothetical protein A2272_03855 [Candidatus Peregrinibacteria bacterium RIFOXYA12_FULL_33_12]OGJ51404.1 MAG: hypothetical protein A2307_02545 [Candidatus Peregrinibacteria bacterium RIFOXYB2_FULL_33_20]
MRKNQEKYAPNDLDCGDDRRSKHDSKVDGQRCSWRERLKKWFRPKSEESLEKDTRVIEDDIEPQIPLRTKELLEKELERAKEFAERMEHELETMTNVAQKGGFARTDQYGSFQDMGAINITLQRLGDANQEVKRLQSELDAIDKL